jgi:hypothetical protein
MLEVDDDGKSKLKLDESLDLFSPDVITHDFNSFTEKENNFGAHNKLLLDLEEEEDDEHELSIEDAEKYEWFFGLEGEEYDRSKESKDKFQHE